MDVGFRTAELERCYQSEADGTTAWGQKIARLYIKRGYVPATVGTTIRTNLADFFAARYRLDPARGYGGTARGILTRLSAGEQWREVAPSVFDGSGSMGNGGAMRAAPIGAFFFEDVARVVDEARRSAVVTHAHREGQAGAIAVAVAASWVARGGEAVGDLFSEVLEHTPDSETRAGIAKASRLPLDYDVRTAVSALGNGTKVISQDKSYDMSFMDYELALEVWP